MSNYTDFIIQETVKLLNIDSPTGYTDDAAEFVLTELRALGYAPTKTRKGGVLVDLGGADAENGVMLETHLDTLGGMVAEIKSNGRLRLTNIGGMNANNAEAENVRVVSVSPSLETMRTVYSPRRFISSITSCMMSRKQTS